MISFLYFAARLIGLRRFYLRGLSILRRLKIKGLEMVGLHGGEYTSTCRLLRVPFLGFMEEP